MTGARRDARRIAVIIVALAAALVVAMVATPLAGSANAKNREGVTLRDTRQANMRFHSIAAVEAAGYDGTLVPQCMDDSANTPNRGGMGVHYINPELLLDGGALDPLHPEAIVYELGANGKKTLVAVEWVVPGPSDMTPPTLWGQTFTWHTTLEVWKLHAWIYRPNPSGIFADYNPWVSQCP